MLQEALHLRISLVRSMNSPRHLNECAQTGVPTRPRAFISRAGKYASVNASLNHFIGVGRSVFGARILWTFRIEVRAMILASNS